MICKMCGEKPCACGGYAKPAPAPLRDAREAEREKYAFFSNLNDYTFMKCDHGNGDGHPHWTVCRDCVWVAIIADRAARQPDVALRELLEEGARLIESWHGDGELGKWARRARKAVPKKPVDEP